MYRKIRFGRHVLDECEKVDQGEGGRIVLFVRDRIWDRFRFYRTGTELCRSYYDYDRVSDGGLGYRIANGILATNGPVAPLLDYLMEICDHPDLPRVIARIMEDAG